MPLIYQKLILRQDLRDNPDHLYVFGDNVQGTGFGGQAAEMRGEINAIGIPTKWFPKLTPKAFFWDAQRDQIIPIIEPRYAFIIDALQAGRTVIWPEDNIGTGLSRITVYAPNLWKEMEDLRINILEKITCPSQETSG